MYFCCDLFLFCYKNFCHMTLTSYWTLAFNLHLEVWNCKKLQERNATIKFHVIVCLVIFHSVWQPVYLQIWVLRDIIGELENQLEAKSQHEVTLHQQLHDLQAILEQQSKTQQELTEEVSYCLLTLLWCLCWLLKINRWHQRVSPSLYLHFVLKAT